jgi:thiol:disulfide interchange protein
VSGAAGKTQTVWVIDGQLWRGGQWRIVACNAVPPANCSTARPAEHIYVPGLNAHTELADARKLAVQQHKRVLVVFGANWCYDCHVLDLCVSSSRRRRGPKPNYEVVHVDVGQSEEPGIMRQYHVPWQGIPAIAVLGSTTETLVQPAGRRIRRHAVRSEDVLAFLNKWKPN